jgi:hypothetical protein
MSIEKPRKRKDEKIISGVKEKGESFFFLAATFFSFFLSFFLLDRKP